MFVQCYTGEMLTHFGPMFPTILFRSSPPEVFLGKDVLKICSKFTGKHPCQIVVSVKSLYKFIEIILRHGWSPLNLLHIFRAWTAPLQGCFCLLLSGSLHQWKWSTGKHGEAYLEPSRISRMELFCENSTRLKAVNYFCKKASS